LAKILCVNLYLFDIPDHFTIKYPKGHSFELPGQTTDMPQYSTDRLKKSSNTGANPWNSRVLDDCCFFLHQSCVFQQTAKGKFVNATINRGKLAGPCGIPGTPFGVFKKIFCDV
jgi:hypothetical protein